MGQIAKLVLLTLNVVDLILAILALNSFFVLLLLLLNIDLFF
jgi:hypothetical protein